MCRVEGFMIQCLPIVTGKTTEEMRKMFNLVNDYSPEEEEQVRRENKCALILIVNAFKHRFRTLTCTNNNNHCREPSSRKHTCVGLAYLGHAAVKP